MQLIFVVRHDGATPLHLAAAHADKMLAVVLMAHGAEVNARDNKGEKEVVQEREATCFPPAI